VLIASHGVLPYLTFGCSGATTSRV